MVSRNIKWASGRAKTVERDEEGGRERRSCLFSSFFAAPALGLQSEKNRGKTVRAGTSSSKAFYAQIETKITRRKSNQTRAPTNRKNVAAVQEKKCGAAPFALIISFTPSSYRITADRATSSTQSMLGSSSSS